MNRFIVVVRLVLLFGVVSVSAGGCQAPPVKPKESASVTCAFDTDISAFNGAVTVKKYYENGSYAGTVLNCRLGRKEPLCICNNKYKFNNRISDELTVEIPSANESHVGRYQCRLVPANGTEAAACTFELKIVDDSTRSGGNVTDNTNDSGSDQKKEDSDDEKLSREQLVAIIMGTVITAACLVILVILSRRLRSRTPKENLADHPQPSYKKDGCQTLNLLESKVDHPGANMTGSYAEHNAVNCPPQCTACHGALLSQHTTRVTAGV